MRRIIFSVTLFISSAASAQSFNIDISPGALPSVPNSTYGAAGRPGVWFTTPATQGVTVFNLVDVNGNVTGASFFQFGGTETLNIADAALTGDDAALMNDCLITHTEVENCLFFNGLEPGEYEVIVYARMPNQPKIISNADVDQEPGNPKKPVGGVWPGAHENGVSYSIHNATVASSGAQAGKLGIHSGVPAGGNFTIGAAMNGLQIHKIAPCPVDTANNDGLVNVFDLFALLSNWSTSGPGADIAEPTNVVDVFDLFGMLSAWGACD